MATAKKEAARRRLKVVWIGGVEQNGRGPSGTQKVGLMDSYAVIVNEALLRQALLQFDRAASKLKRRG
jgi:hypothetical protein